MLPASEPSKLNKTFLKIKVQLIYKGVLISITQQSDSVHSFYIHFHYGISENIECSSLCFTVGPCLSILYVMVCIY